MLIIRKRSLFLIIVLLSVAIIFNGCETYQGKKPFDYGDAIWVCQEQNLWFLTDAKSKEKQITEGEIEFRSETCLCSFVFVFQSNVVFIKVYPISFKDVNEDDRYMRLATCDGFCTFSPDCLIIEINKKCEDTIFNGTVEKLTFYREEIESAHDSTSVDFGYCNIKKEKYLQGL